MYLFLQRLNVNRNTAHNIIEEERKKYCKYFLNYLYVAVLHELLVRKREKLIFKVLFLVAANKSSFEQLITKAKTAAKPCKLPVKCNILSKNNFEIPHNDCIIENDSSAKDNKRDDILSVNSTDFYIDDPDSNTSPGINPIDFLAIEVSSSSSNGTHQCFFAPKQGISNICYKKNLILFNSIVTKQKTQMLNTTFRSILIYEEIISLIHFV